VSIGGKGLSVGKHSTFNIQHSTNVHSRTPAELDVPCPKLNVECSSNSHPWLVLHSGLGSAAFNMAMDEALLEAMPRLEKPVLRFYGWTEPAASFGYFQKFAEVERATLLRPLVRRPTGGGIVPHDADWTYSLAFPPNHEWHSLKAIESYRRVHEWIQRAFARLGVETELAPCCKKSFEVRGSRREEALTEDRGHRPKARSEDQSLLTSAATERLPGQCFVGHEQFDLLWRGRKIAGAAQRRNKLGLLIQGSIQPPPIPVERTNWQAAMCAAGEPELGSVGTEFALDASLAERANELSAKYASAACARKR